MRRWQPKCDAAAGNAFLRDSYESARALPMHEVMFQHGGRDALDMVKPHDVLKRCAAACVACRTGTGSLLGAGPSRQL